MAFVASRHRMFPLQFEPRLIVLEFFDRPTVVAVAAGAVRHTIHYELPGMVVFMAACAMGVHSIKTALGRLVLSEVTSPAIHLLVFAHQFECRLRMVEAPDSRPAFRHVAGLAVLIRVPLFGDFFLVYVDMAVHTALPNIAEAPFPLPNVGRV